MVNDITYKLHIWDCCGNHEFKSIVRSYYRGCKGMFFVFDITNRDSFENITKVWMKQYEDAEHCKGAVMLLIGSKCDMKNDRKVSREEGEKLAVSLGCVDYIETSAKFGINISYCFDQMLQNIIKRPQLLEIPASSGIKVS